MQSLRVSPSSSPLLERDVQLRLLGDALDAARQGGGRLVVIEGEAGIGKSTLLAAALARAKAAGLRVLRARGNELERFYPYGVAVALFEPLFGERGPDRAELTGGPARVARPLFESGDQHAPSVFNRSAADPFALIHGLYWLALNASEHEPLVLAVDDAQWADEASLRFLDYLARRIEELPIVLILAFRTGPLAEGDIARSLRAAPGATLLEPAPLSQAGVGAMLAAAGLEDPDGSRSAAYQATTRGNPLFVSELIRHHGLDPGGSDGGDQPGVPTSIRRFVEARIHRLEDGSHGVAEAIAVLGGDATPQRVADLTGLDPDEVERVVRGLVEAVILERSGPLGFVHPIVRTAVYESMTGLTRGRQHRVAAHRLAADGAPAGVVGAHLLEAERAGSPETAALLAAAADEALAHGQAVVAARLVERALEEPPPADQRVPLLVARARAEATAGLPSATRSYTEALDAMDDPRERAALLLELGHLNIAASNWDEAAKAFERGSAELRAATASGETASEEPALRDLADRLDAGFAASAWVGVERHQEAEDIVARLLGDGRQTSVHRELAAWSAFHRGLAVSGTASEISRIVRTAIAGVPIEQLIADGQLVELAAGALVATDDLQAEIDLLTAAIPAAEAAGAYGKVGLYSYCRSLPLYFTGALNEAIVDSQTSIRTAELGWETFMPGARASQAWARIERGEFDAAEVALEFDMERWAGRVDSEVLVPIAQGRLALADGRPEDGLAHLRRAAVVPTALGLRAPFPDWQRWTAFALAQLGRRTEAIDVARELVATGREWAARWSLGIALDMAGVVEGGADGLEALQEAATLLEDSPARLEHGRVLVDLGAALRRAGHLNDAREVLTKALQLTHHIGAHALRERAHAELRAAGSRPRRFATTGVDSLTPSELRVARLAAEGRTNRQIAQILFVTPKAVEYHLANVYPKLGIASRQGLARALPQA